MDLADNLSAVYRKLNQSQTYLIYKLYVISVELFEYSLSFKCVIV